MRKKSHTRRRDRARKQTVRALGEQLEDRRLLAVVNWDGGGDGVDWHDAANWEGDAQPGPDDDALIDLEAGDPIVEIDQDVVVRSIIANEAISIQAAAVMIADVSQFTGGARLQNATFLGAGDLSLSGQVDVFGAEFRGTGTIRWLGDTNLFGRTSFTQPLENLGTVTATTTFLTTDSTVTNFPGARFDLLNDMSFGGVFVAGLGRVINQGTVRKSGGKSTFSLAFENRNDGKLLIQSGEAVLQEGSTLQPIEVAAGATLTMSRDFRYQGAEGIAGDGTVRFLGGEHDFTSAEFGLTGTLEVNGGDVTIANTISSDLERVGGRLVLDADQTLHGIEVSNGSIAGSGDIVLSGTSFASSNARFEGTGKLIIEEEAEFNTFNSTHFSKTIENSGLFRHRGDHLSIREFSNLATGELVIETAGDIDGTEARIVNEGVYRKQGVDRSDLGAEITSSGRVSVEEGELRLLQAPTFSSGVVHVGPDASISFTLTEVDSFAELHGNGTLDMSIHQQAAIRPGGDDIGSLTINGNLALSETASLEIQVGGTDAGPTHDRLLVNGDVDLGGTLNVTFVEPFEPTLGDQYSVLTATSVGGEFSTKNAQYPGLQFAFESIEDGYIVFASDEVATSDAEQIRQAFNSGVTAVANEVPGVAAHFDQDTGGLPLVPPESSSLNEELDLQSSLTDLLNSTLVTIEDTVNDLPALRAHLADRGYEVECVVGEASCNGDVLRVRVTNQGSTGSSLFDFSADGDSPLTNLLNDLGQNGSGTIDGKLNADLVVGVDAGGVLHPK